MIVLLQRDFRKSGYAETDANFSANSSTLDGLSRNAETSLTMIFWKVSVGIVFLRWRTTFSLVPALAFIR